MKPFVLACLLSTSAWMYAQVGINTTSPNSILEIQSSNVASPSNTDGILIPKIDEFPSIAPGAAQDGMMVYATGSGSVTKGFYYWDQSSTSWVSLAGNQWRLSGNSGTNVANDFIGTTDNNAVSFRTNNTEKLRITSEGKIGVFNTGRSVFIGERAGANDDLSNNQNIAIGYNALNTPVNVANNVAIGFNSQYSNTSGTGNVGVGSYTLGLVTTGDYNVAVAIDAMRSNTTGSYNTGVGSAALYDNVSGERNIAVGTASLGDNTSGSFNTAVGMHSLRSNTSNSGSTAVGYQALFYNTAANASAFGYQAALNNTTGTSNAAFGYRNLYANTTGSRNLAMGYTALDNNTTGNDNIALGVNTLGANTTGNFNIAIGSRTMFDKQTGNYNIAVGPNALENNTNGANNVVMGYNSGFSNVTGSGNVFLGYQAGYNETDSNKLYIDNSSTNTPLIYGDFGLDTAVVNGNLTVSNANGTHANATIDVSGLEVSNLGSANMGLDGDVVPFASTTYDLGNNVAGEHWDSVVALNFVTFSDKRTKDNIAGIGYGLKEILALRPVSFRYNERVTADKRTRLGLIAQEVEEVIPEAVFSEDVDVDEQGKVMRYEGEFKAMTYTDLIPVLIKAIQEQNERIDSLEKELKTLKKSNTNK